MEIPNTRCKLRDPLGEIRAQDVSYHHQQQLLKLILVADLELVASYSYTRKQNTNLRCWSFIYFLKSGCMFFELAKVPCWTTNCCLDFANVVHIKKLVLFVGQCAQKSACYVRDDGGTEGGTLSFCPLWSSHHDEMMQGTRNPVEAHV